MPNWLNMGTPKKEDQVPEITPEKVNENINAVKTDLEARLAALGSSIEEHPTLKAMQSFLDEQRTLKENAERARLAEQQRNNVQQFENVDEATRGYIDSTIKPIADAALWQQGNELRRSIFDNVEQYPYYTGALKDEIDAMIDKQPATIRANADAIRNVYKIVVFDHQKEIEENKHKSRLSSASAAASGTGAPGTKAGGETPVLTLQMKHVAAKMGMSEAEYATAMKELQDAGEYV